MPKNKKKKDSKGAVPYNVKKTSNHQESPEQDSDVVCDKCKRSVDQTILCEACEGWICSACGGIPMHVIDIIADYKQIHWFCQNCNDKVGHFSNKSKDRAECALPNGKSVTEIVSESLSKVVEQFNAAIKDTRDYVKKALEEIIDAPTATGMDMSSDSVRGSVSVPVCSPGAVEVVDEYIE